MPRFTERERRIIRERLIQAGIELFGRFGLRKTSLDMLVRQAQIAKGSFYSFFDSKEELYVAIIEQIEEELRSKAVQAIDPALPPRESLRALAKYMFQQARELPIIWQAMDTEQMVYLLRKLPAEKLAGLRGADTDFFSVLFKDHWPEAGPGLDPLLISGAFRALFFASLHGREIGETQFDRVLDLLIDALVDKIFAG